MASLPTLKPTAFSSQSGTAWTTTTVGNIDNGVGTPDGNSIVAGANSTSSIFYAITNMPADFLDIATLAYNIRYAISSVSGDSETLFIQIFASDGTTALTNEATVRTTTASVSMVTKGSTALTITATGLSASKAVWDGALIRLRTTHSQDMGADGSVWSIDEVELTGTYTQSNLAPTISPNTADSHDFGTDTTPALEFTGSDADSDDLRYQMQVATGDPISGSGAVIDSHSETNQEFGWLIQPTTNLGQSFTGDGSAVGSVRLFLGNPSASTDGNVSVSIYAHSGTFGSSSIPTGSPLATSSLVPIGTIVSGVGESVAVDFSYTGANQIVLGNGTRYVLVLDYDGSTTNILRWFVDELGSYPGNFSDGTGATNPQADIDGCFYVYAAGNLLLDKTSGADAGFVNTVNGGDTDPFTAGQKISYTVQAGDALADGTYYWRARALDPLGTNTWSAWTATRSFTVTAAAGGLVKVWSGSAWVEKPVKVWSGSAWVQKPIKHWNGSAWVEA